MFYLFQTNVASFLFGCCKNRSRYCICMHVASICFKCFKVFRTYFCKCLIWMLHIFAIIFKCFSSVFRKCFRRLFYVFHLSFFYVVTVVSRCFKSRSGVARWMRVESGRRHRRRLARPLLVCSLASL
jgi:cell division protein FtsW (lipid II flippase)